MACPKMKLVEESLVELFVLHRVHTSTLAVGCSPYSLQKVAFQVEAFGDPVKVEHLLALAEVLVMEVRCFAALLPEPFDLVYDQEAVDSGSYLAASGSH